MQQLHSRLAFKLILALAQVLVFIVPARYGMLLSQEWQVFQHEPRPSLRGSIR